jgi:hypothetical protein
MEIWKVIKILYSILYHQSRLPTLGSWIFDALPKMSQSQWYQLFSGNGEPTKVRYNKSRQRAIKIKTTTPKGWKDQKTAADKLPKALK